MVLLLRSVECVAWPQPGVAARFVAGMRSLAPPEGRHPGRGRGHSGPGNSELSRVVVENLGQCLSGQCTRAHMGRGRVRMLWNQGFSRVQVLCRRVSVRPCLSCFSTTEMLTIEPIDRVLAPCGRPANTHTSTNFSRAGDRLPRAHLH